MLLAHDPVLHFFHLRVLDRLLVSNITMEFLNHMQKSDLRSSRQNMESFNMGTLKGVILALLRFFSSFSPLNQLLSDVFFNSNRSDTTSKKPKKS